MVLKMVQKLLLFNSAKNKEAISLHYRNNKSIDPLLFLGIHF
jgi:hypothetical protein